MSNDDPETTQLVGEAEALGAMFGSSGWNVAERVFNETIATLKDVTTLSVDDEDIAQQVRDRINTAAALQAWLDDLKGRVSNVKYLKGALKESNLVERR